MFHNFALLAWKIEAWNKTKQTKKTKQKNPILCGQEQTDEWMKGRNLFISTEIFRSVSDQGVKQANTKNQGYKHTVSDTCANQHHNAKWQRMNFRNSKLWNFIRSSHQQSRWGVWPSTKKMLESIRLQTIAVYRYESVSISKNYCCVATYLANVFELLIHHPKFQQTQHVRMNYIDEHCYSTSDEYEFHKVVP